MMRDMEDFWSRGLPDTEPLFLLVFVTSARSRDSICDEISELQEQKREIVPDGRHPKGEDHVTLYISVVRANIKYFQFKHGICIFFSVINAIKKDKSFIMSLYINEQMKQLLVPLNHHVKAAKIGKI